MKSPFPGMDPYLESPWLWHGVHLALIYQIQVGLAPQVAPRYYVAVEERVYLSAQNPDSLVGLPDVAVIGESEPPQQRKSREAPAVYEQPLTVELVVPVPVRERYLEIREVGTDVVITVIEILSPSNKAPGEGRNIYADKRRQVLASYTGFVEIDLLRAGEHFDLGQIPSAHYRILISRAWERPRAQVYAFNLSQPLPSIPVPLRRDETEPSVNLNDIVHQVYDTARYDLRIDYQRALDPSLEGAWAEWARGTLQEAQTKTGAG